MRKGQGSGEGRLGGVDGERGEFGKDARKFHDGGWVRGDLLQEARIGKESRV